MPTTRREGDLRKQTNRAPVSVSDKRGTVRMKAAGHLLCFVAWGKKKTMRQLALVASVFLIFLQITCSTICLDVENQANCLRRQISKTIITFSLSFLFVLPKLKFR
ncbi:unnamed protein product [Musa acuminata var. zebrina]